MLQFNEFIKIDFIINFFVINKRKKSEIWKLKHSLKKKKKKKKNK